jgi:pyruvate,orthophosphate dikinase
LLVRTETTPEDILGIVFAQEVLTSRGGMTSHAAVVARALANLESAAARVSKSTWRQTSSCGRHRVKAGEIITMDGSTGKVMRGEVPMIEPTLSDEFEVLLNWANQTKKLSVRANADTPEDAAKAREFGAEGIGLCRTEHMFMAQERLPIVQEMILSENLADREAALDKLLPIQRQDFYGIINAMSPLPVCIRLLGSAPA